MHISLKRYALLMEYNGPFTLAIFAAILSVISRRLISRRFESPVVYTDDLKSRLKSQQKSPGRECKRAIKMAAGSLDGALYRACSLTHSLLIGNVKITRGTEKMGFTCFVNENQ